MSSSTCFCECSQLRALLAEAQGHSYSGDMRKSLGALRALANEQALGASAQNVLPVKLPYFFSARGASSMPHAGIRQRIQGRIGNGHLDRPAMFGDIDPVAFGVAYPALCYGSKRVGLCGSLGRLLNRRHVLHLETKMVNAPGDVRSADQGQAHRPSDR